MEQLYNPDLMSDEELKETFVARHGLVNEIVSLIERQPDGAGVQHVVVIAPRGMGKTTLLLMIKIALRDRGLSSQWQAVRFPEEAYGVNDLADFWVETLLYLASETNDSGLLHRVHQLKAEYPDGDTLQEAALALLKDWCRKQNKRLVVLVDNFDMVLEQINNEQDEARLRSVLMNEGAVMLVGAATTFFQEARAYDQPLYNFFKIHHLDALNSSDVEDLLRQRAAADGTPDFEQTLQSNTSRLRVLEYFTGGNPRLVLMLYRVLTQSEVLQTRRALEKLLDEVTPYYKAKTESLPAQQRKILDQIARASSETHEGQTPTQIAAATRLTPNAVSSQLKRLAELGYVRAANLRQRNAYYTLSEPLYAIWHQMRFGRDGRARMQWLVSFLQGWYDLEELHVESDRLQRRFRELLSAGLVREARQTLEHGRYIAEAMTDPPSRSHAIEGVICGYIELEDIDTLKTEVLPRLDVERLSPGALLTLFAAGCVHPDDMERAFTPGTLPAALVEGEASLADFNFGAMALCAGRFSDARQHFARVLDQSPNDELGWIARAGALYGLGRFEEALDSLDHTPKGMPDQYAVWLLRAHVLQALGRYEETVVSLDRALELAQGRPQLWLFRGRVLYSLNRHDEALVSFDRVLQLNPESYGAWVSRGQALRILGRYEEAVASFDQALIQQPDDVHAWQLRGLSLRELDRLEEALASFDRALKITPENVAAWSFRGSTLFGVGRLDDAIASYDRVLEITGKLGGASALRALTYIQRFAVQIARERMDLAEREWYPAIAEGKQVDFWQGPPLELALQCLSGIAELGNLGLARELIAKSDSDDLFFPLARALDYLQTPDEALIEKLSPELRSIVTEIIDKLRSPVNATVAGERAPRAGKAKPGSRRPTRKRLG